MLERPDAEQNVIDSAPSTNATPVTVTAPTSQILFDVSLSSKSKGFKRVYIKNGVLSLFGGNSFFGQRGMQGLNRIEECVDQVRYGFETDRRHDSWHQSTEDHSIDHYHVLKPKREMVTPEEFKCILDSLLQYQRGFGRSLIRKNITRFEDDDDCYLLDDPTLLTEKDYKRLIRKYNTLYYDKHPGKKPTKNNPNTVSLNASTVCVDFFKATTHTFINTLIDKYLKPYLISEKGFNHKQVRWACMILSGSLTAALTFSPLRAGLDLLIKKTFKEALLLIGVDISFAENFAAKMGTIAAITQNPLVLASLLTNYGAAQLGQDLAYKIIHSLPKFKIEPPTTQVVDTIVQPNHRYPLRNRKK